MKQYPLIVFNTHFLSTLVKQAVAAPIAQKGIAINNATSAFRTQNYTQNDKPLIKRLNPSPVVC